MNPIRGRAPTPPAPRRSFIDTCCLLVIGGTAGAAIFTGWYHLSELTGFAQIRVYGIPIDGRLSLPLGLEAYSVVAIRCWVGSRDRAVRRFAGASAIMAFLLGIVGQVISHQLTTTGATRAPGWVTTFTACLPVLLAALVAGLEALRHRPTTAAVSTAPTPSAPDWPIYTTWQVYPGRLPTVQGQPSRPRRAAPEQATERPSAADDDGPVQPQLTVLPGGDDHIPTPTIPDGLTFQQWVLLLSARADGRSYSSITEDPDTNPGELSRSRIARLLAGVDPDSELAHLQEVPA